MIKQITIPGNSIEWLGEQEDLSPLPPKTEFALTITYPISEECIVKFTTPDEGMGLGGIMNVIGKAYKNIYEHAEEYGVWGHGIRDLVLEGITVDYENRIITLQVGS